MSYASRPRRPASAAGAHPALSPAPENEADAGGESHSGEYDTPRAPAGTPYEEERDWARMGLIGAGVAVGLLLGAGIALLFAPQSGEDLRAGIADRARTVRGRAGDAWSDLGDELRYRGHRGRRHLGRKLTEGRWAAEDILDRSRHRADP